MSKVNKILISLSFAFIVAFSFMFANLQPLFAKADSISNYSVSFIAPDNSLLYSTGNYVPSGTSLQELENGNLILNSAFLDNSNGQPSYTGTSLVYTVDSWLISGTTATYTVATKSLTSTVSWQGLIQYIENWEELKGKTITATIKATSGASGIRFGFKNGNSDLTYTDGLVNSTGVLSVTFSIPANASYTNFNVAIWNKGAETTYLDYVKLEVGNSFTGYYNSNLISTLLSSYNFSNYYYQYYVDTSSAITSDLYYYPTSYRFDSDWVPKIWGSYSNLDGSNIWTDGNFYYYSQGYSQYVLDVSSNSWVSKTWYGLTNFEGNNIWTDGNFYYYSYGPEQYVLDVSTSTWSSKTWAFSGEYVIESDFRGSYIWTDGNYYYLSTGNQQFRLDVSTSIWSKLVWSGYNNFEGNNIWTDGSNYYYSYFDTQYIIDVSSYTVSLKTWTGINYFEGVYVWTDGVNIYYSDGYSQLLLDVSSNSWVPKTWTGIDSNFVGNRIWTDGSNYYYSSYSYQYVLGNSALIDDNYFYNNGYNNGYTSGYNNGYTSGYNKGYNKGVEEAGNYTFFSLISAVMDAPLKVFYGLFNFELMGVNLAGFIQALLSLAILLFIIRFALQK